MKGLLPFLIVKATGLQLTPLPAQPFFLNTSKQNFEIAVLFNIVERFRNYAFKDENPLQPLRKGL